MQTTNSFFPELAALLKGLDASEVSTTRRQVLDPLIDQLKQARKVGKPVALNFICTHNSRRSHLAQVWAQTLAAYHGIAELSCYSGGTESTALFPVVAETLSRQGFELTRLSTGSNPVYALKYGPTAPPIIGFSKAWDHPFNPQDKFLAVMTCAQADADCPYVPGAAARIPVTYEDPKHFDDNPLQAEKYRERSEQIAQEMNYVFQTLKLL